MLRVVISGSMDASDLRQSWREHVSDAKETTWDADEC